MEKKILMRIPLKVTVQQLDIKLREYAQQHPDMEIFYDGDERAIVGVKR